MAARSISSLRICSRQAFRITAQQNIDTATGHIGGNGDGAGATGLRNDRRFALMILGIEHFMIDTNASAFG